MAKRTASDNHQLLAVVFLFVIRSIIKCLGADILSLISKIITIQNMSVHLSEFLEHVDSTHTRRAYRADISDFMESRAVTDTRLNEVTASQVRSYINTLRTEGKAVSTQRRRLSALRRFFDWLLDENVVQHNPARECRVDFSDGADHSDQTNDDRSPLTRSETKELIRATEKAGESAIRNRAIIVVILYAALRRSEVAAMDVSHVRPLGRHWVIDLPSGDGWSSAYVRIPETVVEAIDVVQSRYGIEEGALWRSLSNRNRGDRMSPDAIYKMIRRTGHDATLGDVTPETLRQTGLYLAMKAGATIQQVQTHARLQSASSVEQYIDPDDRPGRLSESASEGFVDLDFSF